MTYSPNIPQGTDLISVSQPQLLTNFQQLNLVYGDPAGAPIANSDHYAFDDATPNARKHRQVRLVQQAATPAFAATQGTIFAVDNPLVGVTRTDPYYNFDNGALGNNFTAPLVAIKAFANFNAAGALSANAFNVAGVAVGGVPASPNYDITFTHKLNDAAAGTPFDYVVLISYGRTGVTFPVLNYEFLNNNGFTIHCSGPINTISFAVLTL